MIQRVRSSGSLRAKLGEEDSPDRLTDVASWHSARWGAKVAKLIRSGMRFPQRLAHVARVALDILYWAATFQLRAGLRRRKYARLIRRSGVFNTHFYLSQCRDDPDAQKDPIAHYLVRGAAQGLEPNPLFDTSAYVEQNPAAAAPGKNPLVHLLRSRGGPARALLPDASTDSNSAVGSPGEALLLRHPFHAPAIPRSDRERCVLVVDRQVPTPDQDSGSARMFAIISLLRDIGCAVTFVSDSAEELGEHHEDALRQLGIGVHRGFPAAHAHLAEKGHEYRCALLSRPEQAFRYLPAVRAYAPQATVIYDTVDLHWMRLQREAEVTGNATAREQAERFKRMEQVSAACSDVVVAITPQERDVLLAEVPGARVEVIPDVRDFSPELVKVRLESILSSSRDDPRSEPSIVEKGSAA